MKRYGADRDKEIQRLLQEMPEEGFRLLFDVYHMQLCVYVVQLTDSFQLAEDIVQDFFVAFWERKYYRAITGNFRSSQLQTSLRVKFPLRLRYRSSSVRLSRQRSED